jgi:hypothetical protein
LWVGSKLFIFQGISFQELWLHPDSPVGKLGLHWHYLIRLKKCGSFAVSSLPKMHFEFLLGMQLFFDLFQITQIS